MRNSLKQMLRTPVKTAVFFLLMTFSVALSVLGCSLWLNASSNLMKADNAFITIGTVRQKENTMRTESHWDGGLHDFVYRNTPVFDSYIPLAILEMDNVTYISPPEHRPFYGAVVADCIVSEEGMRSSVAVVELMPMQDCIPSGPVEVEVVRVLYGGDMYGSDLLGRRIMFCDHFTQQPNMLKRGSTYIAFLNGNMQNTDQHRNLDRAAHMLEYVPHKIYADQVDAWEEVTEGFYEAPSGERWMHFVKAQERFTESMVPVTPTKDTQLLPAFHSNAAIIISGRDISQEEYLSGEKVCLVSQYFAGLNHLEVGETVKLGLYNANYESTPINLIGYRTYVIDSSHYLKSNGEAYDVFSENNYTIVGIYAHPKSNVSVSGYALSPNEVIIPANAITQSDANNIVAMGPMQGKNTSFRIPNGASAQFMEALSQIPESNMLEVQFYDNGYDQFAAGMKNATLAGIVLFCVGLAASTAIIILILFFYIVKQRRRTAIERALGMRKRQCIASLMLGLLLLTSLGSVVGCVAGVSISGIVMNQVLSEDGYFSTMYSQGLVYRNAPHNQFISNLQESSVLIPFLLIVGGTLLFVIVLSWFFLYKGLRITPMYCLGVKGTN